MASEPSAKCIEISVETDHEAAEAVASLLSEYGDSAPVIEQVWEEAAAPVLRVKTYLSPRDSGTVRRVEEALWHLSQIHPISEPSVRWLSEADWLDAWRSGYTLQRIGRHVVIKPSWQDYLAAEGELVIELDPGLAFGTGLHPSTRLCLVALEDFLRPGDCVLDVGTGSGILAIASALLGAEQVLGIDIDEMALRVAGANVEANGVHEVVRLEQASLPCLSARGEECEPGLSVQLRKPQACDARSVWRGAFVLVVINFLANVIGLSAAAISDCLRPGAMFVVSGIMVPQEDMVRPAFSEARLLIEERRIDGDWIALVGRKEGGGPRA